MIDNPYWDAVKGHATPMDRRYSAGGLQIGDFMAPRMHADDERFHERLVFWEKRRELAAKYSWSVPDPGAIDFVVEHSRGRLVDPIAGTGYWTYLLTQSGVDCVAYDTIPPTPASEENRWHQYVDTFMAVTRADAVNVVTMVEPDRTLFLSWPPYDDPTAHDVLQAYRGDRLIYIGEGNGGCTGDEVFHELLEKEWDEVADYDIPQWAGLHDFIWVYDRIQTLGQT